MYRGGDGHFRLPGVPTVGELLEASKVAFKAHPKETKARRELADVRGRRKVFLGEVYDSSDPYWRVRCPGGDWEELSRQEIK